jgi:hypothetical protein
MAKPRADQKPRARPKSLSGLPRQRTQKPVFRPQLMARERILSQLSDLVSACEELFEEHGEACCYEACCLVSNLVGSVRVFKMILEIS